MKQLMESWRRFLTEDKNGFKPHMMFDPKSGDKKKAKTEAEHNALAAKGYVHVDPQKIRKALEDEGGAAGTDAIIKRTGSNKKEVESAMDGMPDVGQHKKGDYILDDEDKIQIKEDCWDGYERVPGSKEGAPGSCRKKAKKKKLKEEELEEGEICDKGISYVIRTDPGGKDIKRGKDKDGDGKGDLQNWSARAAQIASKYCKDPDYGKGRGKDAKEGKTHEEEALLGEKKKKKKEEGGLKKWEKENWTHSDGTPCGGGKKDGSSKRCKPAAKWKTMSKGEKAADNAKKKKGTKAGKQYVSATKKGKVKENYNIDRIRQLVEEEIAKSLDEAAKCTKPTKKASSTSKGKKWMKCVKSDSGGYKRIHWGQKGVRVTGKSGNTKRKKSFKARHKCSSAKSNTPQGQACKDWK